MRVVQLLPELNEGGVERGVVDLNRELVKRGIESIVVSSGGRLAQKIIDDGGALEFLNLCSKNPLSLPYRANKLTKLLKRLKPDIIHVRSRVPAWIHYFANRDLKIPTISTVHGFNSVNFYSKIMTKSNRIICVSNVLKEHILKNYKICKNTPIDVIPRGIDLSEFSEDSLDFEFIENFKKEFQIDFEFVITSIGRITPLKDYETFIRAIERLSHSYENIKALIVGEARDDKKEYLSYLQNLVKELEMEDRIIFVGNQKRVAEIYYLSDVVVSSSKKPESFGRSVAEAIALNTPVVATNHGGVLEIIKEGENGTFVGIGDEISLSMGIERVMSMKFDGYEYIKENFSLDKMADSTIASYRALLLQMDKSKD